MMSLWFDDFNQFTSLSSYHMVFVDANKDGLTDVAFTDSGVTHLFLNRGDSFRYHEVPGLLAADPSMSDPVVADLSGQGNEEIVRTLGYEAYSLSLNEAGTGLLSEVDDGKGNIIRFAYDRPPAVPDAEHRPSVLRSVTVRAPDSAAGEVTTTYDYERPVLHSTARYLLGYATVRKSSPKLTEEVSFFNDDDVSGLVLSTANTDPTLASGLTRFSTREYSSELFQGVPFKRTRRQTSGMRDSSGQELARTVEYESYSGVCPTRTSTQNDHGTLVSETILADTASFDPVWSSALHCMPEREKVTGTHADPSLNFVLEQSVARNALGQVTDVYAHDGASTMPLQTIGYDSLHRIQSIAQPGQGTTTLSYGATTGQLAQITAPDGVIKRVDEIDDVSSALRALTTDRGAGGILTASYRYDSFERLSKAWQSFGGSSESMPLSELSYHFASVSESGPSADRPGVVKAWDLIDAATGEYAVSASFIAASGEELGSTSFTLQGWMFSTLSRTDKGTLEKSTYQRDNESATEDPASWSYADLFSAAKIDSSSASGLGHAVYGWTQVQSGVTRAVTSSVDLSGGAVLTTVTENDLYTTSAASDIDGHVLWKKDAANETVSMRYDAAGRLVGVVLADGTPHALRYDGFGRPARVDRPGIGAVTYAYDEATGQLVTKSFLDANQSPVRTVTIGRDSIGRATTEDHALTGGQTYQMQLGYDGDMGPGVPPSSGEKGRLTRVAGADFTRTAEHNPDDSEKRAALEIGGWLRFETDSAYYANGTLKTAQHRATSLASNTVIDDVTEEYVLDAYGRMSQFKVNGSVLASYKYGASGLLETVDLAGGGTLSYQYDPITKKPSGYTHDSLLGHLSVNWTLNERGLVSQEYTTLDANTVDRGYDYDARGFLTQSLDGVQSSSFSYTRTGMPSTISDLQGSRSVFRGSSSTIDVGGVAYTYDSLGRVVEKGDLSLAYGPHGQLARATRGADEWTFGYDEAGNRLWKKHNGQFVAAYVNGAYATATRVIRPVHVAGRLVGVLDNGTFQEVFTDPRGTRLADTDGTLRLATPYGVRAQQPDLAEAFAYVEKGYDPDLGVVRMGVRDYDPALSQFWTPDPLFLESLDKCAESPTECNLYGYARNNPVSFIDPSGLDSDSVELFSGKLMARGRFKSESGKNASSIRIFDGAVVRVHEGPLDVSAGKVVVDVSRTGAKVEATALTTKIGGGVGDASRVRVEVSQETKLFGGAAQLGQTGNGVGVKVEAYIVKAKATGGGCALGFCASGFVEGKVGVALGAEVKTNGASASVGPVAVGAEFDCRGGVCGAVADGVEEAAGRAYHSAKAVLSPPVPMQLEIKFRDPPSERITRVRSKAMEAPIRR